MVTMRSTALLVVSGVLLGTTACTAPVELENSSTLVGPVWQLQTLQREGTQPLAIESPENYTVQFSETGQVAVRADCNRAVGKFTEVTGGVEIILGPTTLAACPPGSLGQDFIDALNQVSFYFFKDQDLVMDLPMNGGSMEFSAVAPTPQLVGTVWQLQDIQFSDGTLAAANPPDGYTVEFMADGALVVKADCNRGRGQFTTDQNQGLTVGNLATTRAACPPGSLSNEFLRALQGAATYSFRDGQLFIEPSVDTGTLRLAAQSGNSQ